MLEVQQFLKRNSVEYRSLRKAMEELYDCASKSQYEMAIHQIVSCVELANRTAEELGHVRSVKVLRLLLEIHVRHISIYGNMPSFDSNEWQHSL